MPQLIAYADLHFIFMSPEMEGQGFPSKVYTIMACAKPLLVVSGAGTPINNFLKPLECSFLVEAEDFDDKCKKIVDCLKLAMADPIALRELGKNGLDNIEKKYSKTVVTQQYVDLALEILNTP